MLKLISFNPNPKVSPSTNLREFIAFCRDKLTLWSGMDGFAWEDISWPDSHRNSKVRFTNSENAKLHKTVAPTDDQLMHPAFRDVAKAYLRYKHSTKPHRNMPREVQALRALERALAEDMGVPDITKIRQNHFNRACVLLEHYSARQNIAITIQQILGLLSEKLIVPAEVIRWAHPYGGKNSYEKKRGDRAPDEVKAAKVANQDAFFSIADVFAKPVSQLDDSDIMVTSMTALFLSAPMRIGETLRWRTDFLRSDNDSQGKTQSYLAYYVPKTRSYTRKAVPTTMRDVAEIAAQRLIEITNEGRKLALYMETQPVRFYRHANCPGVPDDQVLTRDQVAQALGFSDRKHCEDFIRSHTGNYSLTGFTLDSLWQIVLAEHRKKNPFFPYQEKPIAGLEPLKMSESLMCFRRLQLGARASTSPVLLAPYNPDYYRKRLDGAIKADRKNQRPLCFFTKHGYDPNRLNSHALRHFMNRLAKQHGVPIEQITEWSSRATVRQTPTYLHESAEQRLVKAVAIEDPEKVQQILDPVTEEEAAAYGHGPFHRSRYGICRRSWRLGPCNKFADCTNCSELVACKGDKIALKAVKTDRDNMAGTYEAAMQAVEAGERSASLWIDKARPQISRLTEFVNVLENPQIPDGTPIQLLGTDFSHEKVMVEQKAIENGVELLDRAKLGAEYGEDLLDMLDLLLQE
ncbi:MULTISPECIES: integrase [unclassified Pseudomonas]|uniref:integrase n=1 Tax=unclassified Pseudomonas TaxID=196821 RepID=UPI000481984F|nr:MULTISPECIES: integrase [unclassified Pseudomonas]